MRAANIDETPNPLATLYQYSLAFIQLFSPLDFIAKLARGFPHGSTKTIIIWINLLGCSGHLTRLPLGRQTRSPGNQHLVWAREVMIRSSEHGFPPHVKVEMHERFTHAVYQARATCKALITLLLSQRTMWQSSISYHLPLRTPCRRCNK